MGIKIIASDLDGTLMSPDHQTITERTRKTLIKAHEHGIKIAMSTGRTLALVEDVLSEIPFVDYVIYSNGAGAYDCVNKRIVFSEFIPSAKSNKLVKHLDSFNVFYNVYYDGNVYMPKNADKLWTNSDMPKAFLDYYMSITIQHDDMVSFFCKKDVELVIAYFLTDEQSGQFLNLVNDVGDMEIVSSLKGNIEVLSRSGGKGNALASICRLLDCTADETMSFGDASNDCSMLEFASYSYAMENGDEKCKSSAKYITASNAEDGVAQAIEKLCFGKI